MSHCCSRPLHAQVFISDENEQQLNNCDDSYGIIQFHNHDGRDFWSSRRAFLSSYHLSNQQRADQGFKGKLKRSVKELNGVAVAALSNIRHQVSRRRFGVRVFRLTMSLPSFLHVSVRCFTPWLDKKH
uniref:Uncharacterized protein n=1 Tax=Cannabis sativa TaxID=3483 RepID=A0A803Q2Y5_CANSA